MRDSSIGDYKGILNTSIIVAGVNIYDKDITDIIVIGEKDISTIKQYVARFRDLKEVNVHIFNRKEYFVSALLRRMARLPREATARCGTIPACRRWRKRYRTREPLPADFLRPAAKAPRRFPRWARGISCAHRRQSLPQFPPAARWRARGPGRPHTLKRNRMISPSWTM